MGNLDSFIDITGDMSQAEINTENINNIIDELNRTSDQLDSLNNTLSVIAYGSLTYNWDGSGSGAFPTQSTLVVPIQSAANFIGIVYFSRNIDNPILYFATPYTQITINANTDTVFSKLFIGEANSSTGQYEISLSFFATGPAIIYTFYYTILQQPSNIQAN